MTTEGPGAEHECPVGASIFDELAQALADSQASKKKRKKAKGAIKESLQHFVEQFGRSTLGESLVGIEQRTRTRLETKLAGGDLNPAVADVVGRLISAAREVAAQAYAPLSGVLEEFVVPWLEAVHAWLMEDHAGRACTASVAECLEVARGLGD